MINPFSISHLTDVGWLDNTEYLFYLRNIHTHTHTWGKGDEIREYTHTPIPKLHAAVTVAEQVINPFLISHLTDIVGWLDNTKYLFYLRNTHTHTHTHTQRKGDEIREYTHMPTPKLHATVSVAEQTINLFSISHLTDVGWLDNTKYLFYLRNTHTHIHRGRGMR